MEIEHMLKTKVVREERLLRRGVKSFKKVAKKVYLGE